MERGELVAARGALSAADASGKRLAAIRLRARSSLIETRAGLGSSPARAVA